MQTAIVIDIAPAGATARDEQALIASCDLGMRGRARCLLGQEASVGGVAFASVTWEESAHGVRANVDVRVQRREQQDSRDHARAAPGRIERPERQETRELPFSDADPELERWRATGFAIAAMVGEIIDWPDRQGPLTPAPAAPDTRPADGGSGRSSPERLPAVRAVRQTWWVDGRFAAQRGADASSPALGGELSVSRVIAADRWFVVGSIGCSDQVARGVVLVRPSASLGLGLLGLHIGEGVSLALRVAPRLEYIDATAKNSAGVSGHASRWILGVGQALDAVWLPSARFGFSLGAELRELAGPTAVDAYGQSLTMIPAVDLVVQGGIRYALP
jgi:hypothetical protein